MINSMNKLNFFGIGPKMGSILLPWLAATIVISLVKKDLFTYSNSANKFIMMSGIVLLIIGLALYFLTVPMLLKGLKETRLITTGAFSLCQNPLYSSIILFIIPSVSLMLNSWLVLTSSIIGYILFKIFIIKENIELEKFFGEEYLRYKKETPEFLPVNFKKLFH